jgi:hypothetical protein
LLGSFLVKGSEHIAAGSSIPALNACFLPAGIPGVPLLSRRQHPTLPMLPPPVYARRGERGSFRGGAARCRPKSIRRRQARFFAPRPEYRPWGPNPTPLIRARAAPVWMARSREDRLIQKVPPVARKLLPRDDTGCHRARPPAHTCDHHLLANGRTTGVADWQHRDVKPTQRLNKPEAGHLVVGQHVALDDPARIGSKPDLLSFRDQVTDGEDQPSSRISTPWPARSVPRISAVKASAGTLALRATTDERARSRS